MGVYLERPIAAVQRVFKAPQSPKDAPVVQVCSGLIRARRHGTGEKVRRFIRAARLDRDDAEQGERFAIRGFRPQCGSASRLGFGPLSQLHQSLGALHPLQPVRHGDSVGSANTQIELLRAIGSGISGVSTVSTDAAEAP